MGLFQFRWTKQQPGAQRKRRPHGAAARAGPAVSIHRGIVVRRAQASAVGQVVGFLHPESEPRSTRKQAGRRCKDNLAHGGHGIGIKTGRFFLRRHRSHGGDEALQILGRASWQRIANASDRRCPGASITDQHRDAAAFPEGKVELIAACRIGLAGFNHLPDAGGFIETHQGEDFVHGYQLRQLQTRSSREGGSFRQIEMKGRQGTPAKWERKRQGLWSEGGEPGRTGLGEGASRKSKPHRTVAGSQGGGFQHGNFGGSAFTRQPRAGQQFDPAIGQGRLAVNRAVTGSGKSPAIVPGGQAKGDKPFVSGGKFTGTEGAGFGHLDAPQRMASAIHDPSMSQGKSTRWGHQNSHVAHHHAAAAVIHREGDPGRPGGGKGPGRFCRWCPGPGAEVPGEGHRIAVRVGGGSRESDVRAHPPRVGPSGIDHGFMIDPAGKSDLVEHAEGAGAGKAQRQAQHRAGLPTIGTQLGGEIKKRLLPRVLAKSAEGPGHRDGFPDRHAFGRFEGDDGMDRSINPLPAQIGGLDIHRRSQDPGDAVEGGPFRRSGHLHFAGFQKRGCFLG